MLEIFIEKYDSFAKIILYTFIFTSIFAFISYKIIKNYLEENWQNVKNNPIVILFGPFFKRKKGESIWDATTNNFFEVLWNIIQKIQNTLFQPIYVIVQSFSNLFKKFGTSEKLSN